MLLTNLPAYEFPKHKIKEIYSMRWGVETSFRDLKYIIGMLKFHSRKSSFVTQEIYAALIMHNMTVVVSLCVEIPQKERKYEYKIRFSTAACIVKSLLTGGVSPPASVLFRRAQRKRFISWMFCSSVRSSRCPSSTRAGSARPVNW